MWTGTRLLLARNSDPQPTGAAIAHTCRDADKYSSGGLPGANAGESDVAHGQYLSTLGLKSALELGK